MFSLETMVNAKHIYFNILQSYVKTLKMPTLTVLKKLLIFGHIVCAFHFSKSVCPILLKFILHVNKNLEIMYIRHFNYFFNCFLRILYFVIFVQNERKMTKIQNVEK